MLDMYFNTRSNHIKCTTTGAHALYGLVAERDAGVGIFPEGIAESHTGAFFTVFGNAKMRTRIEAEMASCAINSTDSKYYLICGAHSNCTLQADRHEADWWEGDQLSGAYQLGKDHEIGGELAGTDGIMRVCVWTAQNGHKRPTHLAIAPHKAIPKDRRMADYLNTNPLFDGIQVGTCLRKVVALCESGLASDALSAKLEEQSFYVWMPKFTGSEEAFKQIVEPMVFGGAQTALVRDSRPGCDPSTALSHLRSAVWEQSELNQFQKSAIGKSPRMIVAQFRPFKGLSAAADGEFRDVKAMEIEEAVRVCRKMEQIGSLDLGTAGDLRSGGYDRGIGEAGGSKSSDIRKAMSDLSTGYSTFLTMTNSPSEQAGKSTEARLLNKVAGPKLEAPYKKKPAKKKQKKQRSSASSSAPPALVRAPSVSMCSRG